MKISGDWLTHSGAQKLCSTLDQAGFRALFVGGAVRDSLLRLPVAEVDMATDARPEIVTELAEAGGLRVVPTGIDHGTVTVIAEDRPIEVTTFRRDVRTDGRHAVVAYSTAIEEDAARRDFTMNALYADRSGRVIDPLGGLTDLLARRVRFVGDPAQRIREDYLRILRFFRFHARLGDSAEGLDAEGLAACAANSAGLETISRERVGSEMRKLLSAADPAPAVAAMAQAGVLSRVLPGADPRALGPLVHQERGADPDWLRRLAVLGGEGAEARLRLSRNEARELAGLRDAVGSMDSPAILGWRRGLDRGSDAMLVRAAVMEQPLPTQWVAEVARGAAATLPVRAADFQPALTGPALGARMKSAEERWLASDLKAGRADLLA